MKREQGQSDKQPVKEDGSALVTISGECAVIYVKEESCMHVTNQDAEWVVDTAASYHATPHSDIFTTYTTGDFGTVKMGNSTFSSIVGIGDIHIKTGVGCTMVLKDVRHVPDLRLNLISVNALDQQGYDNIFAKVLGR